MVDFDFRLFKQYVHRNADSGTDVERAVYIADMPDISKLVCHEGLMELRTFSNSLDLKMIPGFDELLLEIYNSLKVQGRTV